MSRQGFLGRRGARPASWHSARQAPERANATRQEPETHESRARHAGSSARRANTRARTSSGSEGRGNEGGGGRGRPRASPRASPRAARDATSRKRRAEPRARASEVTSLHMRTSSSRGTILSRRLLRGDDVMRVGASLRASASGPPSPRPAPRDARRGGPRRAVRVAVGAARAAPARLARARAPLSPPLASRARLAATRPPRTRPPPTRPPPRAAPPSPPSPRCRSCTPPGAPPASRAPRRRPGPGKPSSARPKGGGAAGDRGASRSPPAASASSDADASVDSRRAAERVVDAFLALPREDQIDIVRRLAFPDAALPESSARAEEARRADERRGVADERDDDEKRYIETAGRSRPLASSDPLVGDDRGSSSAEDLDADLSARLADARDGWKAPSPSVAGFASNDSVETASSTPSPPSTLSRESSAAAFGGIRDLFENATREGEAVAASVASAARSVRVDGDVFVAGAFGALVLIAAASELASAAERSSRNERRYDPTRERYDPRRRQRASDEGRRVRRGGPLVAEEGRRGEPGVRLRRQLRGVLGRRCRARRARRPRRARRRRPRCFGLGPRARRRGGVGGARGGGARAAAEGDEGLRFDGRGAGRGKAGRFSYGSGSRRGSDRDRFGGPGPSRTRTWRTCA